MAPARSTRRPLDNHSRPDHQPDPNVDPELFIDPMLGTPLPIYIEKDVADKDALVDLILVSRVSPGPWLRVACLVLSNYSPVLSLEIRRNCLARLQRCSVHPWYVHARRKMALTLIITQSTPINHRARTSGASTPEKREKSCSIHSGFTNASRPAPCRLFIRTGRAAK